MRLNTREPLREHARGSGESFFYCVGCCRGRNSCVYERCDEGVLLAATTGEAGKDPPDLVKPCLDPLEAKHLLPVGLHDQTTDEGLELVDDRSGHLVMLADDGNQERDHPIETIHPMQLCRETSQTDEGLHQTITLHSGRRTIRHQLFEERPEPFHRIGRCRKRRTDHVRRKT